MLILVSLVAVISKFNLYVILRYVGVCRFYARPALILALPFSLIEALKILGATQSSFIQSQKTDFPLILTISAEIFYVVVYSIFVIIWYWLLGRIFRLVTFRTEISFKLRHQKILMHIALILFFLLFYYLSSQEYGVLNWLKNPRLGYQFYREGYGIIFATLITLISIIQMSVFYSHPNRRNFLFVLVIFLAYLTGSKDVLLNCVIFQMVLMMLINKLKLQYFLIFGLIGTIFILINFIQAFDSLEGVTQILKYFDYYSNGSRFYGDLINGKISLYGGDILLTNFQNTWSKLLPIEEPFRSGDSIIIEHYYPGAIDASHYPAFGGQLTYIADFGPIGLLFLIFSVEPIISALGIWLYVKRYINTFDSTLISFFSVMFLFSGNFGMFFPGVTFYVLTLFSIHGFKFLRFKKWK